MKKYGKVLFIAILFLIISAIVAYAAPPKKVVENELEEVKKAIENTGTVTTTTNPAVGFGDVNANLGVGTHTFTQEVMTTSNLDSAEIDATTLSGGRGVSLSKDGNNIKADHLDHFKNNDFDGTDLKDFSYTPTKITISSGKNIRVGDDFFFNEVGQSTFTFENGRIVDIVITVPKVSHEYIM